MIRLLRQCPKIDLITDSGKIMVRLELWVRLGLRLRLGLGLWLRLKELINELLGA
jgi:hypothetical protein